MNAAKMKQLVTELKDEINTKLHHRTLLEYTGQPPIWEDQLFYLLLPQFNGEQWTQNHQVTAQSVVMIQTALTTHDLVKEFEATSKQQQLMVLAGDYYSGRYYATLAELPNIQLVSELSDAVAEISENKTAFYEPVQKDLQQWIEIFEVIVSKAIESFMTHFEFKSYIPLIQKGMLVNRLSTELQRFKQGTSTVRFVNVIAKSFETADEATMAIRKELQGQIEQFQKLIRKAEFLNPEIKDVLLGQMDVLSAAQHMTREG